jgi:hypothetical protein
MICACPKVGHQKGQTTMTNKNLKTAVTLGFLAATALLLSLRYTIGLDGFVAYAAVLSIAGLGAMEYGISWKNLFGR